MGFCALFLYKSDLFFYQKDIFTLCVVLFSLASCSDDSGSSGGETVNTKRQIKVAVVLPASESLIRTFAMNAASTAHSEPFLWALTETDVSQTEAMLAKIAAYGGKKVAILSSADIYGKTFFDWAPYIAAELKLELVQNVRYTSDTTGSEVEAGTAAVPLATAVQDVFSSGADYVLCALSSYKDAESVLAMRESMGDSAPKLLFTDTAFTADFLKYGENAEGVEGTAPYADPTSGFSVMYEARFNEKPSVGEAHLYDSLLLCGFAAADCIKNEATTPSSNKAANNAIKSFTGTGKDGKSAWSLLGMECTG